MVDGRLAVILVLAMPQWTGGASIADVGNVTSFMWMQSIRNGCMPTCKYHAVAARQGMKEAHLCSY